MAKPDKLLTKLQRKPAPSDFTWRELTSVLQSLGCVVLSGKGSRRKFHHPPTNLILSLHEPHPNPEIKRYMINEALEFIDKIKP